MRMSFWWDYNVSNFLFHNFNTPSIGFFLLLCFGLLLFAFLFEWLKMIQAKVRQARLLVTHRQLRSICPTESDTLITNSQEAGTSTQRPPPLVVITRKDRVVHFVNDLSLWLSQNIMGYLLMLTVMFYNGYMVIFVIVGSAIGYFLFGPTLIRINVENCRMMRSTFCMADCGDPDKTSLLHAANMTENRTAETSSSPMCHHASASTTSSSDISENNHITIA